MELFKEFEEKHARNAIQRRGADSEENVQDLAGTRPKRPRVTRIRKEIPGKTCLICGGNHKVLRCEHLDEVRKFDRATDSTATGKRKCSVCGHRGHT
jgi:hypothetical protein